MRKFGLLAALVILTAPLHAESLRGPIAAELSVTPVGEAVRAEFGLDEIVLLHADGDPRFFDAVELEIVVPAAVSEFPGALTLLVTTTGTISERAGVAEINGVPVFSQPLLRPGKLIVQIPLHDRAETTASAAVSVLDEPVPVQAFPLAATLLSPMKGAPASISGARVQITMSPVSRRIGSVSVRYLLDDGSAFPTASRLTPEFSVAIDGSAVDVLDEYLLEPGLHRISLSSERYQDQELTFGVERGRRITVDVPLLPALATVSYTTPRGSRVYLDGRTLSGASGDFTATPGEHTIVVVVGDYTVTRRFSVKEGQRYNLSVTMDLVVEETK